MNKTIDKITARRKNVTRINSSAASEDRRKDPSVAAAIHLCVPNRAA